MSSIAIIGRLRREWTVVRSGFRYGLDDRADQFPGPGAVSLAGWMESVLGEEAAGDQLDTRSSAVREVAPLRATARQDTARPVTRATASPSMPASASL